MIIYIPCLIIILTVFPSLTTSKPSFIVKRQENVVNGTDFLIRYGFLRTKGIIQNDEGQSPVNIEEPQEEKIRNAILNFQQYYGLEQTGELDDATLELMGARRCGDPDIYDNYKPSNFVLYNGQTWNKRDLTYDVLGYSNHMGRSEVDKEFARALKSWSDVTNLKFTKLDSATSNTPADIRVTFQRGIHDDGPDNAFDGTGGTLAHAYFPRDGRLHFDEDELWTTDVDSCGSRCTDLYQVALHELGHNLGLEHSNVRSSIMFPYLLHGNNGLENDDIAGIQALYGRPPINPSTSTPPTPPSDCGKLSNVIGRCGVSYGRCNKNLAEWAIYCNSENFWCGNTEGHRDAQEDDKYDWNPLSCPENENTYHNVTNGCNQLFPREITAHLGNEKHAVRCCNNIQAACLSPDPCQLSSTFTEAENICSQQGLTLCSRQQNLDSICCKTGCEIDATTMWIADDSKTPESIPCEAIEGTLLQGDNGKSSCYIYHKGQHIYDFDASKQYCEEFGGALVTITGPKDQENVFRMISDGITANANSNVWIGAKDNKWLSTNTEVALSNGYTNWQEGEPTSLNGCVVMLGDVRKKNQNGNWFVYNCDSKHYAVVCQIETG